MLDLKYLCERVAALAIETGMFIEQESKYFTREQVEFKSLNSLVSYVDKEAERRLVAGLYELLPSAGFIAEEGTGVMSETGLNWVVDPLDGTTNFIHGIPVFAVSIALMEHSTPILGVIYEVNRRECFSAWLGGGAWLNGWPIRVSPTTVLSESLIATGFPYYDFVKAGQYSGLLKDFMPRTRGIRRLGSAATDLAYVACGRFDGFYEYNLSPWDVAGGAIIVREAGGYVPDFKGGNNFIFGKEILASGQIHGQMLEVIMQHF